MNSNYGYGSYWVYPTTSWPVYPMYASYQDPQLTEVVKQLLKRIADLEARLDSK